MLKFPVLLAVVLVLAGCSGEAPRSGSAVELGVVLESPVDAVLSWKVADPRVSGVAVEFTTGEGGEYTTLQYAPVEQGSYRHPDLIPSTDFSYRVRAYSGAVGKVRKIALPPGELDDGTQAADHAWVTPKTVPGVVDGVSSVRAGGGVPGDFRGTVVHANGILFTWVDRADDEDGYLIEVKAEGASVFTPAAVVEAGVNSAGLITLPGEKVAEYRVRAFCWGEGSNVVRVRTGADADSR